MSIVKDTKTILMNYEKEFNACPHCNEYSKALKEYKELIDSGITKPRENNLLPIEKRFDKYYEVNNRSTHINI